MELLCPLCQCRLSIGDQHAGQLVRCPTCSGMFQAPTLPDMPTSAPPPPPPVTPPSTFKVDEPAPTPASPPPAAGAPVSPPPGAETPAASAPLPETPAPSTPLPSLEGGFNHVYVVTFSLSVMSWVAVVGMGLIFLLSFMPWSVPDAEYRVQVPKSKKKDADEAVIPTKKITAPDTESLETMWSSPFVLYIIFYFLTLTFAVVAILVDKKIIKLPDPVKKLRRWRSLIVAGLAAVGFFALLLHWASTLNFFTYNPNTAVFSIVMFVQFLVMVGPLLEYWLQQRKKDERPVPRIEFRW
jgi:hypothetical protein